MDAAASGEQMRAGRMTLKRTAKSCRSDAPMLASSLREGAQATVSNKPGHRGEREVSRKTIARGMPGDFRCDRGDYARVFVFLHTRGCGRVERPAFPAPSDLQKAGRSWKNSRGRRGEIAELCFELGDTKTLVMPGLDPGIHLLRKSFLEADGLPGQARQ